MSTTTTIPSVLIYEAERISGPHGAVQKGDTPIAEAAAIVRLKGGGDIVVCSTERRANRNKARELMEAAFGTCEEDAPHTGRMSLPHYHAGSRSPEVHAFFEAPPRLARKRKSKS